MTPRDEGRDGPRAEPGAIEPSAVLPRSSLSRWLSIRQKTFLGLAFLSAVGGSGGLLSALTLRDVARAYQEEQHVVAVHEAIHEDRIALLNISLSLERATATSLEQGAGAFASVATWLGQAEQSAAACTGCHRGDPEHVAFGLGLMQLRAKLVASPPRAAGQDLTPDARAALSRSIATMEKDRAHMEQSFHDLLERRRLEGRDLVQPTIWQHVLVVLAGLVVAVVLAWYLSRSVSRHLMPLITAARRLGQGQVGRPVGIPRDPDLGQVAVALNDMAILVAERAREDVRRQLLDRMLSSQEDERKRVARELHDTIGQALSALLMDLKARPGRGSAVDASSPMVGLEARITGLLEEVHRLAWDLRPSLLDDLGLASALGRYTADLARRRGLRIDFQAVGFPDGAARLPSAVETVLYRVAQEALSNVKRHAQASHVSVVLVRRAQTVALLIEDDGCGFEKTAVGSERPSLGILGMEERVALAGGDLVIESTPGKGTAVRAQLPILEKTT